MPASEPCRPSGLLASVDILRLWLRAGPDDPGLRDLLAELDTLRRRLRLSEADQRIDPAMIGALAACIARVRQVFPARALVLDQPELDAVEALLRSSAARRTRD